MVNGGDKAGKQASWQAEPEVAPPADEGEPSAEQGEPSAEQGEPSADQLIKAMINFELHGLMDCAYDLAVHFRERLRERLDADKAADLLLARAPHARNTADVVNCLRMIAQLRLLPLATGSRAIGFARAVFADLRKRSEPTQP